MVRARRCGAGPCQRRLWERHQRRRRCSSVAVCRRHDGCCSFHTRSTIVSCHRCDGGHNGRPSKGVCTRQNRLATCRQPTAVAAAAAVSSCRRSRSRMQRPGGHAASTAAQRRDAFTRHLRGSGSGAFPASVPVTTSHGRVRDSDRMGALLHLQQHRLDVIDVTAVPEGLCCTAGDGGAARVAGRLWRIRCSCAPTRMHGGGSGSDG